MSILTSRTLPLAARTTFSRIGVSCLHGPHQVAQKSTSTGTVCDAWITSLGEGLERAVLDDLGVASGGGCGCTGEELHRDDLLFLASAGQRPCGPLSWPVRWPIGRPAYKAAAGRRQRPPSAGLAKARGFPYIARHAGSGRGAGVAQG